MSIAMAPHVEFQPSLFGAGAGAVAFDAAFASVTRIHLDAESWLDFAPGWVIGSDALFAELLTSRRWGQRTRWMYDREVQEPRLTSPWSLASGAPLEPPVVDA